MNITQDVFDFLKDLEANNNREWFQDNKERYEKAHADTIDFADDLLKKVSAFDEIETASGKKSLMRIYRDIRFSKDKTPYKTNFGGGFKRLGANRRGGIYFHIKPNECFIGGGFWGPNKDDLLLIRQQIDMDSKPLRDLISSKQFKNEFGSLDGEQLKSCPKGFDKESPELDLLRYKQFLISKPFSNEVMLSDAASDEMAKSIKAMLPFFDVMTEYLTTDLNGESIID